MSDLAALSTATTLRLDASYYSVLEKLSLLQATVLAIKDVAVSSRESAVSFAAESASLAGTVETHLGALDSALDAQQKRAEALAERIADGRAQIAVLSARVDVVRDRVASWERADKEWQERIRTRLRRLWMLTSGIALLLLLVALAGRYAPEGTSDAVGEVVGVAVEAVGEAVDVSRAAVGEAVDVVVGDVVAALEAAIPGVTSSNKDGSNTDEQGKESGDEEKRRRRDEMLEQEARAAKADLDDARGKLAAELVWSPQSVAGVDGGMEERLRNWSAAAKEKSRSGGDDRLRLLEEL